MTKKRTWEEKVTSKKPCGKKCECAKVVVSKESLEDGRITKNELLKDLNEARDLLQLKKSKICDLELKLQEQDNIIKDMFDDMVDISNKAESYKFSRNVSIIFNIVLIILLILGLC